MRIFSFIKHSGLNFSEGVSRYQVSVTVSLRSKIFENFFVYRMLWTSNFLHGVFGHQLCLVTQNLRTQIFQNFFIYRVLWTLNLSKGVSGHQLSLVTLNLKSKIFWNFFIYIALWTLDFSQGLFWVPTFFGHTKLDLKNFS